MYWTDSERELLRKLYKTTQYKDLEPIFGRSASTIQAQAEKLGLNKRDWTEEDNETLKRLYPLAGRYELETALQRKWRAIVAQAYRLGIKRMGKHSQQGLKVRFENSYIPEPNSGCWLWTGTLNPRGYGGIGFKEHTNLIAHRVSWILHRGEIPDGLCVCHKCDNPPCVNPDHLFLGTHQDNKDDCCRKKRHRYGEKCSRAKLTDKDVIAIRKDHRPVVILAALYHVSPETISGVRHGRNWRHLL